MILAPIEYAAKIVMKKLGMKVVTLKFIKVTTVLAKIGKIKLVTFKVVLVGGKIVWATLKVVGAAILGATISQTLFGGG